MSNLAKSFQNGRAFIPFITCGDPDLATTAAEVREAVKNGADGIVLGIPFSDPTAEGPVIQAANIRALKGGVNTEKIFELVQSLRRDVAVPIVFMTYANVVFSYGTESFVSTCRDIGVDGLILPDIPYEEKDDFLPVCRRYGVKLISMIAPTTAERIGMIAGEAEGFLYIVPGNGRSGGISDLSEIVRIIRENTALPCVVGAESGAFEQAAQADLDGVIVSTSVIELLERYGKDAPKYIGEYVKAMKDGLR